MSCQDLVGILPPPAQPVGIPRWGTRFDEGGIPEDYREFLSVYGIGAIDGFLWMTSPVADNENLNLWRQTARQRVAILQFMPHAMDPVVFAISDNGDICFWERGAVCVLESRGPLVERFELQTTGFLLQLLTRQLRSRIFPEDYPGDELRYVQPQRSVTDSPQST